MAFLFFTVDYWGCKFCIINGGGVWVQNLRKVGFALWRSGLWDLLWRERSPRVSGSLSWLPAGGLGSTSASRWPAERLSGEWARPPSAMGRTRLAVLTEARSKGELHLPQGWNDFLSPRGCGLRQLVLWPPGPASPPTHRKKVVRDGQRHCKYAFQITLSWGRADLSPAMHGREEGRPLPR